MRQVGCSILKEEGGYNKTVRFKKAAEGTATDDGANKSRDSQDWRGTEMLYHYRVGGEGRGEQEEI